MESNIVSDGAKRLRDTEEHWARLEELRESIRARYDEEMAEAGFFRRVMLCRRIDVEFQREREKLEPSPDAVYLGDPESSR